MLASRPAMRGRTGFPIRTMFFRRHGTTRCPSDSFLPGHLPCLEIIMNDQRLLSRRGFCLCCIGGAVCATGWLSPRQAYAEARGIVSLIKDSAATAEIAVHPLRNNVSIL